MRVLMAEDLDSVREHLAGLLLDDRGIELAFTAQDAALLTQTAAEWRPDVVILDIRMRGMFTLGILEKLKQDHPRTAVVVSGFFFEPYYRVAFLRHGADFFIDKTLEWKELIAFLRRRQAQLESARSEISDAQPPRGAFQSGYALQGRVDTNDRL